MPLHLGKPVPNFQQDSTEGRIDFFEFLGNSWGVLFSHPADFTPVCTTELGAVAKLKSEFEKRNTKVIGLSVDPVDSHHEWVKDINDTQRTTVNFPLIADHDRSVAKLYDMLPDDAPDTMTVRSVFIVDPKKVLRLTLTYPASTGRNFQEILRVIDSLQLTDHHKVATPADWQHGDRVVIVPSLRDPDELAKRFPQGFDEQRPYLRLTDQPKD
ncbi:MAG: peroxiredoxin [Myxococcota bacterium]